MFWERYCSLCRERGTSPTAACLDAGLARSCITKWRNGSKPDTESLMKLAVFFEVSISYLRCESDDRTPPGAKKEAPGTDGQGEEVVVFHRGPKPRAYHLSEEQLDRIEAIVKDLRGAEANF